MADFSIGRILRKGFGGLFDAHGRDARMQFWMFLALVLAPLLILQMIIQMVLAFPPMDLMMNAGPKDPQAAVKIFEAQMRGMTTGAYVGACLGLLGAIILLTATARRLHDRGHSGWWALALPFGVAAAGLGQARQMLHMTDRLPQVLAEVQRQPPSMNPFDSWTWMAKANVNDAGPDWLAIVGGLILLWLVIELARAGTAGSNRFGPAPDQDGSARPGRP